MGLWDRFFGINNHPQRHRTQRRWSLLFRTIILKQGSRGVNSQTFLSA